MTRRWTDNRSGKRKKSRTDKSRELARRVSEMKRSLSPDQFAQRLHDLSDEELQMLIAADMEESSKGSSLKVPSWPRLLKSARAGLQDQYLDEKEGEA